ncbi:MAG: 1,4-dihydroxy-6-naphthoate synthase [Deltaproteobacteria bacterium]|nr:1,4-dihydroxy-6-naphthoate synthase [Deltaproteobacteria bacterium]
MPLSFGYSPCPNDTFIFCALANRLIDLDGLKFNVELHDVETLNRMCRENRLDVTKISIAAYAVCRDEYELLTSGSAIGRGCGPIIVAKPGVTLEGIREAEVAVPGLMTTACFLFSLYAETSPNFRPMTFDRIMPAVSRGECHYGIIIHEGRFTYKNYGLQKLLDLGSWWEEETGLPIPLGGIAIRRRLDYNVKKKVNDLIRRSLTFASKNLLETSDYVRLHAQEMKEEVIREHISLYVNDFTMNLGDTGKQAIEAFIRIGAAKGLILPSKRNIFRDEDKITSPSRRFVLVP